MTVTKNARGWYEVRDPGRLFGRYPSHDQAERRVRQVQVSRGAR